MRTPSVEDLRGAAFDTPLGAVVAIASPVGLRRVTYELDEITKAQQAPSPILDAFGAWLRAYLAKQWAALPPVPLDLQGTPADKQVWDALLTIQPGRTTSYAELAAKLGKPSTAARAIGAAVGRNPAMIIVPCHRVLASDGKLTGYAGGVSRKAWLLKHEGRLLF